MNQADLRSLADERILDAKALLDGQRWSFAYYTAGYAVECALKSCVLARMVITGGVFEEKWKPQDYRIHDVEELVKLAGLIPEFTALMASNANFRKNWDLTVQWDVSVRYEAKTQSEAEQLYEAITNDPDGVMQWLRKYW